MDGIGATKAKKRCLEAFDSIATKTLKNKIRIVRQKVLNAQLLKGMSDFISFIFVQILSIIATECEKNSFK